MGAKTTPSWIGRLLTLFGLLLLGGSPLAGLQAASLSGQVTAVPSGREIVLISSEGEMRQVLIAGIRTPAPIDGKPDIGRRRLHTLLAGRQVTVEFTTPPRGGVILGRVLYGGSDIALRLLQSGLAEVDPAPLPLAPSLLLRYRQAEASARLHGMGYWQTQR